MIRRPPRSTHTDTRCPCTTLFRSAAIVWCNSGPGDPLRGRHAHACDAINLVVQGGMYMDGIWLRPGQAKIVPADTNYGDATVSGEGCIFLEIFGELRRASCRERVGRYVES